MPKTVSVRIPDDLYKKLKDRAEREMRSVSNLVILILRLALIVKK